jgi:tetratricopeptide (TPR) repeat protein
MVNLVRLYGSQVELPYFRLQYSITPLPAKLQAALEGYDSLRLDVESQALPLAQREEVIRFLRQLGALLREFLFPAAQQVPLNPKMPLLLELGPEWAGLPWELLHDGGEWWALRQGIVRYLAPPDHRGGASPLGGEPLCVAAVTARAIPVSEESALKQHEAQLGTRFITVAADLLESRTGEDAAILFNPQEDASREDLEAVLRKSPHALLLSAFSSAEGFYLESGKLVPQKVGIDWLCAQVKQAVQAGLRLLVLNDSLALLDSRQAAVHGRALLDSGLPGLIRYEGRLTRLREQDYIRSVLRLLSDGASLFSAHRSAVRRLARRFEESWDWTFPRLYMHSQPPAADFYLESVEERQRSAVRQERQPGSVQAAIPAAVAAQFASPSPPPPFAGRRRTFNRYSEMQKLADMLLPDGKTKSPLVFLSGPPGSGKTMVALDVARRLHRRFAQTAYVHARDLLPDPFELVSTTALTRTAGGSLDQLFSAVARHLGVRGGQRASGAGGSGAGALGAGERWDHAVKTHLGDGEPRLIVVDRLESVAGYDGFCAALLDMPPSARFLLLGRRKSPLVAGKVLDLAPLDLAGLVRTFGDAFLERLEAMPLGKDLRDLCAQDLLVGRLLRRIPRLPPREALERALQAAHTDSSAAAPLVTGPLLTLLLDHVMGLVSADGRAVLAAQCLFSHFVHRDVLADVTAMERRRLQGALTELQWLGLLDAYDGERYFLLPPRLQNHLAEGLLTTATFTAYRERLALAYPAWLSRMGPAAEAARRGFPLLSWSRGGPPDDAAAQWSGQWSAHWSSLQRLGIERANVAELAMLHTEERDWAALQRLSDGLQELQGVPEWADCLQLVNHCLLGAGEAEKNAARQAGALCRLGQGKVLAHQTGVGEPLLTRALDLVSATSAWDVMADVYHWLAVCHRQARRHDAAVNLQFAAVELAQQTGRADHLLRALEELGALWQARDDGLEQAEQFLPPRIEYLESQHQGDAAARVRRLLGDLYQRAGRGDAARALYHDVEAHFRSVAAGQETYVTALRLAEGHALEGQPQRALDVLQSARQEWGGAGDPAGECRVLLAAAEALQEQGDVAAALDSYLEARRLLDAMGDRDGVIRMLDVIGGLYFHLGDQAKSTRCYQERLQLQAVASPS